MITGVHALIYSPEAERVRAVLRDVFGWPSVDAGNGWPIFAMPPTEIAVHPSDDGNSRHELYLMCDDVEATVAELGKRGLALAGAIEQRSWGRSAAIRLPDGSELGIYEPRHPTAIGLSHER